MADKILQTIGLAKKAGRCAAGAVQVEEKIKKHEAKLVICAGDASGNTKKHLTDMCSYRGITLVFYSDRQRLGRSTGKDICAACAILDGGLADKIESMIREVTD